MTFETIPKKKNAVMKNYVFRATSCVGFLNKSYNRHLNMQRNVTSLSCPTKCDLNRYRRCKITFIKTYIVCQFLYAQWSPRIVIARGHRDPVVVFIMYIGNESFTVEKQLWWPCMMIVKEKRTQILSVLNIYVNWAMFVYKWLIIIAN